MRRIALIFSLMLCFLFPASYGTASIPDIFELVPAEGTCLDAQVIVQLYAGPTVQYPDIEGGTVDLTKPYVCFGQSDSWSLIAQGTPERFSTVGWVQTAAIPPIMEPELSFTDRLPAMVEEDAPFSFGLETDPILTISRGEYVQILGRIGSSLYVETEKADHSLRGFIPESTIE